MKFAILIFLFVGLAHAQFNDPRFKIKEAMKSKDRYAFEYLLNGMQTIYNREKDYQSHKYYIQLKEKFNIDDKKIRKIAEFILSNHLFIQNNALEVSRRGLPRILVKYLNDLMGWDRYEDLIKLLKAGVCVNCEFKTKPPLRIPSVVYPIIRAASLYGEKAMKYTKVLVEAGANVTNIGHCYRKKFCRDPDGAEYSIKPECSALSMAAKTHNIRLVKYLLEKGARPDLPAHQVTIPPLHESLLGRKGPNFQLAEILLAAGADINQNATDPNRCWHDPAGTPIAILASRRNLKEINWAISKGAKFSQASSSWGGSPLAELIQTEKGFSDNTGEDKILELVKRFVGIGADVNIKGYDNRTPLMVAATMHYPRVVRFLIDSGAKTEARDKYDRTALFYIFPAIHWPYNKNITRPEDRFKMPKKYLKSRKNEGGRKERRFRALNTLLSFHIDTKRKDRLGYDAIFYAKLGQLDQELIDRIIEYRKLPGSKK